MPSISITTMVSSPQQAESTANPKEDLLVITCASGKQASALLPNLVNQWQRLRLVCHSPSSEANLKKTYPKADVTRADLGLQRECDRILKDATLIYHVEPPFVRRQAALGFNVIDAARKATQSGTFKHFVYASVLNPQLSKVGTDSLMTTIDGNAESIITDAPSSRKTTSRRIPGGIWSKLHNSPADPLHVPLPDGPAASSRNPSLHGQLES